MVNNVILAATWPTLCPAAVTTGQTWLDTTKVHQRRTPEHEHDQIGHKLGAFYSEFNARRIKART